MPYQHLGEAGFTFLDVKNITLIGVGMVAEKIRSDPNWRMWASIVGVCGPILLFVSWSHATMIEQIDLRMEPLAVLVEQNTTARNLGSRYTSDDADTDRKINNLAQQRLQKQVDHINAMLSGSSRFSKQGDKMEGRILRLENRVFIDNSK